MNAMLLLKVTLLLSVTLFAVRLLCRAPASTRHRLGTITFASALALPLLAFALPSLHVPMPAAWRVFGSVPTAPNFGESLNPEPGTLNLEPNEAPIADIALASPQRAAHREALRFAPFAARSPSGGAVLLLVWLIGTAVAVARLLLSLFRARRLARAAEDVTDPVWRSATDALGTRLGLHRAARLLISPGVGTPMAGGIRRPVVFLPLSARRWSAEQREVVLAHEIAHLAARDPLRHVAARLAVALYWFHPLVWIAAWQASVARELACDEAVLALGTRPSVYAGVLLDLAESMQPSVPALALPMVERSLLERRMMTILNEDARRGTTRRIMIPTIGMVLLTLSLAAAQPARSPSASNVAQAAISVSAQAAPAATDQTDLARDSACWWDSNQSSFRGSTTTSDVSGRTVIREQIGSRGSDRVIQRTFGDVQLCMLAEDAGDRDNAERPSQWVGRARRVIMEARRGTTVQRLEIGQQAGGGQRILWQVGSAERTFDAAARQWRERMLAVLDTTWELATLRGEVSSLRGQISSIHGQQSSLRGQISSLRGEVSSMHGRASSVRGEESSLRGRISSIRGHVSSLRGEISSERGAISSVNASRYWADASERAQIADRIKRHEAEIARIEQTIRDYNADAKIADVEREIRTLDAPGKAAAIDAEIRAFDLDGKIAAVERRIAALDVQGKVAAIERQIDALDADRRSRQLEERRESELRQLEAAIAAIR